MNQKGQQIKIYMQSEKKKDNDKTFSKNVLKWELEN